MKQRIAYLISAWMMAVGMSAQTIVSGTVTDGRVPLAGANVFIDGSIDGSLTDSLGRFSFPTREKNLIVRVTCIGFDDYRVQVDSGKTDSLMIRMHDKATSIHEVVVTASSFCFGKGDDYRKMGALDVVMSGNSCGDLVAALQILPGSQKVGEDGKLYVRGGSSEECQTFVNGMHVLVPYTTTAANTVSRGRFSPFLFKGINFSLGGYPGEYGQALSSVLPMETTDVATGDKLGVSASLVNWSIGGTKSFRKSSLAFNTDYTSMGVYDQLFSQRLDFMHPYRKLSGEVQYKHEFSGSSIMKSYVGYDLTTVAWHDEDRRLSLKEHNFYANVTHRLSLGSGYMLFMGIAHSLVTEGIDDALVSGDRYDNFRNEVHLKADVSKVMSRRVKMQAGMESYLRNTVTAYDHLRHQPGYQLAAAHLDVTAGITNRLFVNMSGRAEYLSRDGRWMLMPRASVSYMPTRELQFSLVGGRYSQLPDDERMMKALPGIRQSTADHAVFSMQYSNGKMLLRIEPYDKKYHHLPLWNGVGYGSDGYGYSRGVDVFFEHHALIRNLRMSCAYSYNDSRRLYLDDTTCRMPEYASRHNIRLNLNYQVNKLVFGLADVYASGRHFAGGTTPCYQSIDGTVTFLASEKVIVYGSVNNIFGRRNVNRIDSRGRNILASRDRFIYLGIFISLKNDNKAYDISNF